MFVFFVEVSLAQWLIWDNIDNWLFYMVDKIKVRNLIPFFAFVPVEYHFCVVSRRVSLYLLVSSPFLCGRGITKIIDC